jgi:hypothetical protein
MHSSLLTQEIPLRATLVAPGGPGTAWIDQLASACGAAATAALAPQVTASAEPSATNVADLSIPRVMSDPPLGSPNER